MSSPPNSPSSGPSMDTTVLFLLRQQARTELSLMAISDRLEKLERKISDIQNTVNASSSPSSSKCSCRVSDDSGGEYSRTTNGTTVDEDELVSLLDQIAKYSQTIRDMQQTAAQQQLLSLSAASSAHPSPQHRHNQHHHQSQQQPPQPPQVPAAPAQVPHHQSSSAPRLVHHHHHHRNQAHDQAPQQQHHHSAPNPGLGESSLSALLFDPNLSSVLADLLTSPRSRNQDLI